MSLPRPPATDRAALVGEALRVLDVQRLVFAIHDASFPSDEGEDTGVGSPHTRAAARLLAWLRAAGFTGVQLGPQGRTSRGNPSPYDATMFSRNPVTIPLRSFAPEGPWSALVPEALLARAVQRGGQPPGSRYEAAYDALAAITEAAFESFARGARPELAPRLAAFRAEHAAWLERDALYDALRAEHGDRACFDWPRDGDLHDVGDHAARRRELLAVHARAVERYAFVQMLAHDEHERFHALAAGLGLTLFGDLQVGASDADAWGARACFLRGYLMGAPPSRTNPDGQPWNYPVLDPDRYDGDAGAFFSLRLDKSFAEYDGLRVDHPHGLICPWVYRAGTSDPLRAVQQGARLFASPDLPDHPELARFSIPRADQIDRAAPRHADGWVKDLDAAQVDRYARLFDRLVGAARTRGRSREDIACEVLSTMPFPLGKVLARHGLGRYRVAQKANLDDPADVYRAENARPEDWVMLGSHDTPSVWRVARDMDGATRALWTRHLSARLGRTAEELAAPGALAHAMLAELFASRAQNVSIFFADVFGVTERYNAPGTVSEENWSLRLPASFAELHRDRSARGEALDLALSLAWALDARGPEHADLASRLRALR